MRAFFVEPDEILKPLATLIGREAHHIRKVLRLKPGARLMVTDGQGQTGEARIHRVEHDRIVVEVLERFPSPPSAASRALVVAQALLKDRKMDTLIRGLTELGMTTWLPFGSARSVPQPDHRRLQARQKRWDRIAREAVKQCGRRRLPVIRPVDGLADVIRAAEDFACKIMFWEAAEALPAKPSGDSATSDPGRVILVVGPEGGFTAQEAETARRAGFKLASLGPRILRAETATLAAVSLVQYLYGDWASPPRHRKTD